MINDKILELVAHFNYLGCNINYKYDIKEQLQTSQTMCGTINRMLRNKTQKDTKLKFYKHKATPAFLYGCESYVRTH
jgi:hypothetical protein